MTLQRTVAYEILDGLSEEDPDAIRSRRDLQRLNRLMGSAGIIATAMTRYGCIPQRIIELGAGDGSLMLGLAKQLARDWPGVRLSLLDRQKLLTSRTCDDFRQLGWRVEPLQADALEWAKQDVTHRWDIAVANLFIHHFDAPQISALFTALRQRTDLFIACEPRRARLPLLASRLVGLIGANAVTRKDAVVSVQGGFRDAELSALWPADVPGWRLDERPAGLFSHCFIARRQDGS